MDVDFNDIVVFAQVVRSGGFAAAGRALGLPGSAVSKRVARLEGRVGYRLLERTTRRVGLTPAGRRFYEHTARIREMVDEGVRSMERGASAPSGTLRVSAPPDDAGVIWALLTGFLNAHPDVDLELEHTLERVDLVEAQVDVALRGGPAPDTTELVAHRLFDSRILLVASPAYLALRGVPTRVEQLAEHDGVSMDAWAPNAIRRVRGDRSYVKVQMRNRVKVNGLETSRRAALDGLGIAPLLELTCASELASGALVEVLPGALPDSAPFWALASRRRDRSAAASALLEHLTVRARSIESGGV